MSKYSVLTLRTIPRSDGRCSVVATREPSCPQDPEVLGIEGSCVGALSRLRTTVLLLTEQLGGRMVSLSTRYHIGRGDDRANGTAVLVMELDEGQEVVPT